MLIVLVLNCRGREALTTLPPTRASESRSRSQNLHSQSRTQSAHRVYTSFERLFCHYNRCSFFISCLFDSLFVFCAWFYGYRALP